MKTARHQAAALARAAGWQKLVLPDGPLHLWIDFYPPTRRGIDDDNALARFKPQRDGLADALGIDDRRFRSRHVVHEETRKGGAVVVRLTGGMEA